MNNTMAVKDNIEKGVCVWHGTKYSIVKCSLMQSIARGSDPPMVSFTAPFQSSKIWKVVGSISQGTDDAICFSRLDCNFVGSDLTQSTRSSEPPQVKSQSPLGRLQYISLKHDNHRLRYGFRKILSGFQRIIVSW
jgi:hypothetical protein